MSHTSSDNRQNAEADKPVISPEHTGKFYGQLLTILDRTKDNILNVMGDTFKETVSQADKAESYKVSKLLGQPYNETRLAYATWNLINIFYSAAAVYKAGDHLTWKKSQRDIEFFAIFGSQALDLENNMLLMVTPRQFSKLKELTAKKNQEGFKQGIHVNNNKIFLLGINIANLLIEINPASYPPPDKEPNMTSLFKHIKKFPDWFNRMQSLPDIITGNLRTYFLSLSKNKQFGLLDQIPSYPLDRCVKKSTFEALMTKETVVKNHFFSDSEDEKPVKNLAADSDSKREKTIKHLSSVVTEKDSSTSEKVKPKKRKKKTLVNQNPISDLSLKWASLHTEYFADTYDPKSRFHGCVDGYANSVYTIFETLLAYLWLKAGYDYGKTRQQRRTDVMTTLSEKSNTIFVLLKEYDRLSNPNSSELVKTATVKHLFFSSETTRGSQQYIINQLTAEWDTLSRCIETAKPQFTGHFHDKILDCLDDLDNAVKRLRHEITKEMPTLKLDNDDDYDVQVVANCDW